MSIAISLPIHDWTPQFKAVLGSLRAQSGDIEIAVMMTRDNSQILADLEASGLQFAYSRTGPDEGQAAAIKEGWDNTRSPILAWLNTDDALTSGAISIALSAFDNDPDLDVFYGHSTISDSANNIFGYHPAVQPPGEIIRRTNIVSQPSCFVRRRAIDAIGGINPDLHFTMDWDLWLRLFENGAKFQFSDQILSNVTWELGTKTAGLARRRLYEFQRMLRRSQSRYKTSVGLLALYRSNRKTYKYGGDIAANCTPLRTARSDKVLPIINMHGEVKSQLHIHAADKIQDVTAIGRAARPEYQDGLIILNFDTPITPGETAKINLSNTAALSKIYWC